MITLALPNVYRASIQTFVTYVLHASGKFYSSNNILRGNLDRLTTRYNRIVVNCNVVQTIYELDKRAWRYLLMYIQVVLLPDK